MRTQPKMIVANGLSLVCLTIAVICAILFLSNLAHAGFNVVSLWLLCLFLVFGIVGLTLLAHGFISKSDAITDHAGNDQSAGNQVALVPPPGDAANSAGTNQPDSQAANGGIGIEENRQAAASWWHNGLQLFFTGAVAAATIMLAVFGGYQLNAIRHQIGLAESTLEIMQLDQRAWLIPLPPDLKKLEPDKHIECQIAIRNVGRLPARIDKWERTIIPWTVNDYAGDVSADIADDDSRMRRETQVQCGTVSPSAQGRFQIGSLWGVTTSEYEAIKNGDMKLYIWGTVTYSDRFNVPYTTEYFFEYDGVKDAIYQEEMHNDMK